MTTPINDGARKENFIKSEQHRLLTTH